MHCIISDSQSGRENIDYEWLYSKSRMFYCYDSTNLSISTIPQSHLEIMFLNRIQWSWDPGSEYSTTRLNIHQCMHRCTLTSMGYVIIKILFHTQLLILLCENIFLYPLDFTPSYSLRTEYILVWRKLRLSGVLRLPRSSLNLSSLCPWLQEQCLSHCQGSQFITE